MKSKKAKEFIEENLHWEQDKLFGIRSFEVMYVDNAINAVELAEEEYRNRAIEAFCEVCPTLYHCCCDIEECNRLNSFLHALDNPKTE